MSDTMLQIIWFALWGLLWAIYFSVDGFDLGAGMLAGLFRKDEERELLVYSLAPIWDGNEVWVITAGGVTFAAFPKLYATMFSSLYLPLMLILLSLVLRAVSIEFFHYQGDTPGLRRHWSGVLALSSLLVALLFGVAFGNIFQGLLLDGQGYHGTVLSLLNPYGLLTGVLFVAAFLLNGAAWAAHKTKDAEFRTRTLTFARKLWPVVFAIAAAWLIYTPFATNLMDNFLAVPVLFVVPLLAVVALVLARSYLVKGAPAMALLAGSATVFLTVLSGIIGLYPNMFPSKLDPAYSLTAFNASSSPYTLQLMLTVTLIFLPLVLTYQIWAFRIFAKGQTGHDTPF
jgi:cytochrome d ubiquinol oxidase subunit II